MKKSYFSNLFFGMGVGWLFGSLVISPPITQSDGWVVLVLILIGVFLSFCEKD